MKTLYFLKLKWVVLIIFACYFHRIFRYYQAYNLYSFAFTVGGHSSKFSYSFMVYSADLWKKIPFGLDYVFK